MKHRKRLLKAMGKGKRMAYSRNNIHSYSSKPQWLRIGDQLVNLDHVACIGKSDVEGHSELIMSYGKRELVEAEFDRLVKAVMVNPKEI